MAHSPDGPHVVHAVDEVPVAPLLALAGPVVASAQHLRVVHVRAAQVQSFVVLCHVAAMVFDALDRPPAWSQGSDVLGWVGGE
jgi:hypothetical protein